MSKYECRLNINKDTSRRFINNYVISHHMARFKVFIKLQLPHTIHIESDHYQLHSVLLQIICLNCRRLKVLKIH